ncbi:MAG: GTPase Era [Clostridiales bacterium]|nr:GTPase Era [Clostridiales bacterium]MCD8370063.1 GTPase Era [Clostridiales bacterium]
MAGRKLDIDALMAELGGKKGAGARENDGPAGNTLAGEAKGAPAVPKKSGFVTLIGRPNVGKSTLMNHLIGQKIAITSRKPQTTRNRIQTVYTDERGQIIFVDTPGIHKAKNRLGEYMVNVAEHTLKEVDVILWLVEPTTFIGAGERHIAEELGKLSLPVILVINKIDTLKDPKEILTYIDAYKDVCRFAEIVPVSALRRRNTDRLIDQIFQYLPYGPQFYDEDTVTDQPMRQIAAELIREKALRLLDEEIPHGIAVTIERMSERPNGIIDIEATIICEKESHKGIVIGKGGEMLKKIGSQARREIETMMETKVNLQLWVKVRKEWRDSEVLLKNYGYHENEK